MRNVRRHFHPHAIRGIARFVEIYALLLAQCLMDGLLLTVITTHRLRQRAGYQPQIAVDLHVLTQINLQRLRVDTYQRRNINDRARITVWDVLPPLPSSRPFRCFLSSSRNWLGVSSSARQMLASLRVCWEANCASP